MVPDIDAASLAAEWQKKPRRDDGAEGKGSRFRNKAIWAAGVGSPRPSPESSTVSFQQQNDLRKEKAPSKRGREQHVGNGGGLSFSLHEAIRPFFSFRKSIRNASPFIQVVADGSLQRADLALEARSLHRGSTSGAGAVLSFKFHPDPIPGNLAETIFGVRRLAGAERGWPVLGYLLEKKLSAA